MNDTQLNQDILTELKNISKQLASSDKTQRKTEASVSKSALAMSWLPLGLMGLLCLAGGFIIQTKSGIDKVQTDWLGADTKDLVEEGETIRGYQVTSGYGARSAPETNQGKGSSVHKGVDLATPVGTLLYSPGKSKVACLSDPTGYGTYATVDPLEVVGVAFIAGHLQNCQAGTWGDGQGFATTGNSGNSSGAHLHWGEQKEGEFIQPHQAYLEWVLSGQRPSRLTVEAKKGLGSFADKIARQESGGDIGVVNEIGAMGKYQFMPDTLAWVSEKALGRSVSKEEFLSSEALQDQIADAYWAEIEPTVKTATNDPDIQCRMMASYHYSGDINLWDSQAPQDGYPSIAAYTEQVCGS